MAERRVGLNAVVLLLAAVAAAAGAAAYGLSRPASLKIAVGPKGGTEPSLLQAYALALKSRKMDVRLEIVPLDGVLECAEALRSGKVDLAVVRPDIALPDNGLTLMILREQAALILAPGNSGIAAWADLGGRRLGFVVQRSADKALISDLLSHDGLDVTLDAARENASPESVVLLGLEEADIAAALQDKRIDAVVTVTTPTSSAAARIAGIVRQASPEGVKLIGVQDVAAFAERMPKLAKVTIPAGLLSGNPRLPADDLTTIGATYRLMARSTMSRSVAASVTQHLFEMRADLAEHSPSANAIRAPAYDSTAEATSAKLPIHPGAIDYFEREQESLIERYETWIYLVAFFGGGIGSVLAWLRQRLSRLRRERIEVATERLLEIRDEVGRISERARLAGLAEEVDGLAADIAQFALSRPAEARTLSAATIAIDAARSTVMRKTAGGRAPEEPLA